MSTPFRIVLSCEHGGNRIPAAYQKLFAGEEALLATHRGYDIGILPFARFLARELAVPLHAAGISRLLVDLNRSRRSSTLFSEFTRNLPGRERETILRRYYEPYRREVTQEVGDALGHGAVLHLSLHSFTPELHGSVRRADIGLLYDPVRPGEADLCHHWQTAIARLDPNLQVRRNYPYRGISDCLVTTLRRRFADAPYLGIELEINQKLPSGDRARWRHAQRILFDSFWMTISQR